MAEKRKLNVTSSSSSLPAVRLISADSLSRHFASGGRGTRNNNRRGCDCDCGCVCGVSAVSDCRRAAAAAAAAHTQYTTTRHQQRVVCPTLTPTDYGMQTDSQVERCFVYLLSASAVPSWLPLLGWPLAMALSNRVGGWTGRVDWWMGWMDDRLIGMLALIDRDTEDSTNGPGCACFAHPI